ncbi:MAG: pyridoxamine 5'-phosphate oxidase family protein [Xanthomonadaceae bacterium]|nr:pyridoxamine 5'-phosphate oxidase family protein [Xanthomonadaceae bacterium]MDP2186343.1 pyridoxamine 5'-phosphate oxidase family protein [Xanthomonadales bacterium]MDZ4379464.1 pyridoxamine 5'-phosphate oxidase family protein [Xanthomonadaceae bacterium]
MGKQRDVIDAELSAWLLAQPVFFVASAPLSAAGHINCSPKGLDAFRVLGPRQVAYVDIAGSGAETVAHLRENGRIVFMFCAFCGPPKIVRLHGSGRAVLPADADWELLRNQLPVHDGTRSIIVADITRVSSSCGFGVPTYEQVSPRSALNDWVQRKGEDGVREYQRRNNRQSIDGLPAIEID